MNLADYLKLVDVKLEVPTANEPCDGEACFRFAFGAYGETKVDVFADSDEDALEVAAEWLDDNAPGHLVRIGEAELAESAKELGVIWPAGDDSAEQDAVMAHAETDLTCIGGHTRMEHGEYVRSHEWQFWVLS
jgi:hypothetical protein